MSTLNNWKTSLGSNILTHKDKIRELLKIRRKLVLVQVHELERLHKNDKSYKDTEYVNNLYDHYIVNKLPKTYLC